MQLRLQFIIIILPPGHSTGSGWARLQFRPPGNWQMLRKTSHCPERAYKVNFLSSCLDLGKKAHSLGSCQGPSWDHGGESVGGWSQHHRRQGEKTRPDCWSPHHAAQSRHPWHLAFLRTSGYLSQLITLFFKPVWTEVSGVCCCTLLTWFKWEYSLMGVKARTWAFSCTVGWMMK